LVFGQGTYRRFTLFSLRISAAPCLTLHVFTRIFANRA
jgi:hypothetical protein